MQNINTEFYGSSTVGERGQIVIPAEARNSMNIKPGDKFVFVSHGKILHLIKSSEMDSIIERMHSHFEKAISKVKEIKQK